MAEAILITLAVTDNDVTAPLGSVPCVPAIVAAVELVGAVSLIEVTRFPIVAWYIQGDPLMNPALVLWQLLASGT